MDEKNKAQIKAEIAMHIIVMKCAKMESTRLRRFFQNI